MAAPLFPIQSTLTPAQEEKPTHIAKLEQRLDDLFKRVQLLEGMRAAELREIMNRPMTHRGHPVIGRIPIWGSGRSLIIVRTGRDKYDLDVIDD